MVPTTVNSHSRLPELVSLFSPEHQARGSGTAVPLTARTSYLQN